MKVVIEPSYCKLHAQAVINTESIDYEYKKVFKTNMSLFENKPEMFKEDYIGNGETYYWELMMRPDPKCMMFCPEDPVTTPFPDNGVTSWTVEYLLMSKTHAYNMNEYPNGEPDAVLKLEAPISFIVTSKACEKVSNWPEADEIEKELGNIVYTMDGEVYFIKLPATDGTINTIGNRIETTSELKINFEN